MISRPTRVITFGVFDKFHKGHQEFFDAVLRDHAKPPIGLTVIVARAEVVEHFKHRLPYESEAVRLQNVQAKLPDAKVILGDSLEQLGKYTEIHKAYETHDLVICLGYDQTALKADLECRANEEKHFPWGISLETIAGYCEDTYHTSVLYPQQQPLPAAATAAAPPACTCEATTPPL